MPLHPARVAQDEFRAAAADVEDEQRSIGGEVQGEVGADGGVGKLGLAVSGDDLNVNASARPGLADEVQAVGGVAQGAGAHAQNGLRALPPGLVGEAGNGVQRPGHGRFVQTLGRVHALAEPGHVRLFGDDGERAVVRNVGDGHFGGVGPDVNGGEAHEK